MKVTKRIASLFLALMMALSVMAVTAAAYGDETHVHSDECCEQSVIARKPGAPECPDCNKIMVDKGVALIGGKQCAVFACGTVGCPQKGNPVYIAF